MLKGCEHGWRAWNVYKAEDPCYLTINKPSTGHNRSLIHAGVLRMFLVSHLCLFLYQETKPFSSVKQFTQIILLSMAKDSQKHTNLQILLCRNIIIPKINNNLTWMVYAICCFFFFFLEPYEVAMASRMRSTCFMFKQYVQPSNN